MRDPTGLQSKVRCPAQKTICCSWALQIWRVSICVSCSQTSASRQHAYNCSAIDGMTL